MFERGERERERERERDLSFCYLTLIHHLRSTAVHAPVCSQEDGRTRACGAVDAVLCQVSCHQLLLCARSRADYCAGCGQADANQWPPRQEVSGFCRLLFVFVVF